MNTSFAIDLIAEQPVNEVESRVISCDGGGGALGHPKVYINLVMNLSFGYSVAYFTFCKIISLFLGGECCFNEVRSDSLKQ